MTFHGLREGPTAVQAGDSGRQALSATLAPATVRASAPPEARGISGGVAAYFDLVQGRDLRDRARRHLGPVREACVCGGPDIVAVTFLPHDVMAAVQRHQIEPVHLAYDKAGGIPLASWQVSAAALDAIGVG